MLIVFIALGLALILLSLRLANVWIRLVCAVIGETLFLASLPTLAQLTPGFDMDPGRVVIAPAIALGATLLAGLSLWRQTRIASLAWLVALHSGVYAVHRYAHTTLDPAFTFGLALLIGAVSLATAVRSPALRAAPAMAILGAATLSIGVVRWMMMTGYSFPELTLWTGAGALFSFVVLAWLGTRAAWTRATLCVLAVIVAPSAAWAAIYYFPQLTEGAGYDASGGLLHAPVIALLFGAASTKLFPQDERPAAAASPRTKPQRAAPQQRASTAPSDVFISYKREERGRVETIAEALRALKLSVWFDARLQSGHSFDDEINREVRGAKAVLVCWSPGAVASEWVRAEASIGRQRGVLTACFLEECEPFPPFNLVHAEHLGAGALDAANPAWVKIVDQIGVLAGRPGLGAYAQLGVDKAAAGAWLAQNASDPLADAVLARLRQS